MIGHVTADSSIWFSSVSGTVRELQNLLSYVPRLADIAGDYEMQESPCTGRDGRKFVMIRLM
jgi:hypothetical protein